MTGRFEAKLPNHRPRNGREGNSMKTCLTALTLALVFAFPVSAAPPPSRQVAALKRENATLRAQVKRLKADLFTQKVKAMEKDGKIAGLSAEVTKLTADLTIYKAAIDLVRAELNKASAGMIGSMEAYALWPFIAAAATRFTSAAYSVNYYSSGNYESYSFTRCGFC